MKITKQQLKMYKCIYDYYILELINVSKSRAYSSPNRPLLTNEGVEHMIINLRCSFYYLFNNKNDKNYQNKILEKIYIYFQYLDVHNDVYDFFYKLKKILNKKRGG